MKIDYISDIHTDFWVSEKNPNNPKLEKSIQTFINTALLPSNGDILIIAGDLGHYFHQDTTLLLQLKKYYKYICLVYGNHDLYLVSHNIQEKYGYDSFNRVKEMKSWCKENGIFYLDGKVVDIDGVKIGGLAMWYDFSFGIQYHKETKDSMMELWREVMNDSNLILNKSPNYIYPSYYGGKIKISTFNPLVQYESELDKLNEMGNVDIMVTHFGPKIPGRLPGIYNNATTGFYYFDGISHIERINPKIWIFGHTHSRVEEKHNNTTLLCNPLGYPSENTYNSIKTINLSF